MLLPRIFRCRLSADVDMVRRVGSYISGADGWRVMRLGCIFATLGCLLAAQNLPTFEAASFKRTQGSGAAVHEITPTSLTIRNASLGNLIRWAYGLEHFQVVGPDWRERPTDVIYAVSAKSASPVSASQMDEMLQVLLKERLALSFNYEQRALPV